MNFSKKIIILFFIINLLYFTNDRFIIPSYSLENFGRKLQEEKSKTQQDKKTAKEIQRAAKQIYRQAINLFEEGAYWSCARELFVLMDFYSKFNKIDGVIYYMAECLYEEEMNEAAIKMYKYIIKKHPDSEFAPAALFGLEKASYKEGKYKETLTIYYQILKNPNNKSIIDAARYFAGQSHYYLKNYDTAINVFKRINSKNSYYDSALYSTALAYLKKKSIPTSIDYFRKIVTLPIISGERRRIVDDARLTLGYIYYELGSYKDALNLFSDISDRHENYQDALLALGWTNLKLGNNEAAIKPLLKLIDAFPGSANAEESYFLLGQAYIMIKEYDKALQAYKTIVELFSDNIQNINIIKKVGNRLESEQAKIEQLKVQVLIQESKLLTTLSLSEKEDTTPKYLVKEQKKIENFRENLITNLMAERDNLIFIRNQIDKLRKVTERKEKRKDWRGYAEYGISRALFLKEMEMKAN